MIFKGIPIDGKLNDFILLMQKEGFVLSSKEDNIGIMKGSFIGENCEIYIISSPLTYTVWKVTAFLPEKTNWYSLKNDYNDIKQKYILKYGEPTNDYHFFASPYEEGDGYEMTAIAMDKCYYRTFWEIPEGSISTGISKYKQISLSYEDKLNVKIKQKEENDQVMNDI